MENAEPKGGPVGTITSILETLEVARMTAGEIGVYLELTKEGNEALGDVLSSTGEVQTTDYGILVKVSAGTDEAIKTSIKVVRNVVQDFLLTLSEDQTKRYLAGT